MLPATPRSRPSITFSRSTTASIDVDRQRHAEDPGFRELRPQLRVDPRLARVDLSPAFLGQRVGEDLARQRGELLLLFREGPVHQRGALGMPRPTIAMMSRCTSFVPPPNVRISELRYMRSMRPCRIAPGEPSRTAAFVPSTSINKRYASVLSSEPKTFVADAVAGLSPFPTPQAMRQFMSLSTSAFACTRARCTCTHSWSITRRPSAGFVDCAPPRAVPRNANSRADEKK